MIRLIAALDAQRGIATDAGIPWKLPADTAYFRRQTEVGLIVMGTSTYAEFSAPLHERDNFVLTSRTEPLRPGFHAVRDLDELVAAHPGEDVWVIGGARTYAATLAAADELLLTQVAGEFGCTKFFPAYEDAFALSWFSILQHEGAQAYRYERWRPRRDR